MFTTYLGLAALFTAITGGAVAIRQGIGKVKNSNKAEEQYKKYEQLLKEYNLSDIPAESIITEMNDRGLLDYNDYEKLNSLIADSEKQYSKDGNYSFSDFLYALAHKSGDHKEIGELYENLSNNISKMGFATNIDDPDKFIEDLGNTLTATNPNAIKAPAPSYLDVAFDNYQREIDPVKLWTGQELADLHDINYDPDYYYDLIKQGTSAETNRALYESAILNNQSLQDDVRSMASYLDSIRNSRSAAINSGITAGAQAVNDVLSNVSAFSDYAAAQGETANNRLSAVNDALLSDAQAKLTARNYFDQLAQSLATDSVGLYANDTSRFGQDWLSNAEFYTADQELRGQRAYSNANMFGNYANAQAQIGNTQANANAQNTEYAYVLKAAYEANKSKGYSGQNAINRAILDTNQYIKNRYTGYNNIVDLLDSLNN